jgi:uncharacterized membrane protein
VDGDISQVTLLVLGFLIALGLLIFTMDWLEDSIDAPPSRVRQRLFGLLRRWAHRPVPEEGAAAAQPPELPRQRESPENGLAPPLGNDLGRIDDQAPRSSPQ